MLADLEDVYIDTQEVFAIFGFRGIGSLAVRAGDELVAVEADLAGVSLLDAQLDQQQRRVVEAEGDVHIVVAKNHRVGVRRDGAV